MRIRRLLEPDNINDVSRIYALSWKTAYKGIIEQDYLDSLKYDHWSELLLKERSNLWIMSDGKQIIGASTYDAARDEKFKDYGEIVSLYLLPSYYRKGYGTKLLHASMNELFSKGYTKLYLWVLEENHSARQFYEKNGFKFNGDTMQFEIGGKLVTEIRYVYEKDSFNKNL